MKIIENKEYIAIRKKFIDAFLNYSNDLLKENYYKNNILNTVDGLFHSGYFWDVLNNPKIIKEDEAIKFLCNNSKNFYILWDNNIYVIREVKKYPIFSALKTNIKEFRDIKNQLPLDIYVFDVDFNWLIAFTHENIEEDRYCLFVR